MSFSSFKVVLFNLLGRFSRNGRLAFLISYVHNRHRLPHFNNPKDLSEIWIKRVLDGEINKIYYLADKYAVRDYVKNKGLESILTQELGVYENAADIDFGSLPNQFALKANFGAGRNLICTDKSKLDIETARKQIDVWLKPSIYSFSERHYNLIPKKIVCEAFINDGSGGFPVDYKFMCINGKAHCILACSGREKEHADYLPYSINWKPKYDYYRNYPSNINILKEPSNLKDMIEVAEKLAKDIDLVRVDLYSNGKQIWFGEMTLTPSGCIFHRWSDKAIVEMGKIYRKG